MRKPMISMRRISANISHITLRPGQYRWEKKEKEEDAIFELAKYSEHSSFAKQLAMWLPILPKS